jgi:hypothetical protein
MRRKLKTESTVRAKRRRLEALKPLAEDIGKWATAHAASVGARYQAGGTDPPQLTPRQSDVMELLFCIADEIGGGAPERAVKAALEVFEVADEAEDNLEVAALRDTARVLATRGGALSLAALVSLLKGLEDSPWKDLGTDGLTTRKLTRLLVGFGLPPHDERKFWLESERKWVHGIKLEWLKDAIQRWEIQLPGRVQNSSRSVGSNGQPVDNTGKSEPTEAPTESPTEPVRKGEPRESENGNHGFSAARVLAKYGGRLPRYPLVTAIRRESQTSEENAGILLDVAVEAGAIAEAGGWYTISGDGRRGAMACEVKP